MARISHQFKRVVLGLQPSSHDRIMKLAAELAGFLELDLLGLFLEDPGLRHLAGIPFAREFQPLGGGWHPIDLDRLSHDLDVAARSIERTFLAATKRLPTQSQFQVIREPIADAIASISRAGDIIMICEPDSPAESFAQRMQWFLQAALQSAAATMLVPSRILRASGPIVAIAVGLDDPAIQVAAAVAIAAKEELIVVKAYEARDDVAARGLTGPSVAAASLKVRHLSAGRRDLSDPSALTQVLGDVGERLIILTRGEVGDRVASRIAAAQGVPVLLIEPFTATDRVDVS